MLSPALYIVPTPIGNLDDITLRAIEVLKNVTLIAAEDTRHSRILLDHLGVTGTRVVSCYDQVEEDKARLIIDEVQKGGSVALISDAGSPLINDPGYRVVTLCVKEGVQVIPLPGPCALITALEFAALPTDRFMFQGFFPVKQKELSDTLEGLKGADYTAVFYETPRRILDTCKMIAEILPDSPVSLCRELTKTFESCYRMPGRDLPAFLAEDPNRQKGEFVVAIGALEKSSDELPKAVLEALKDLIAVTPVKAAAAALAKATGLPKNDLYQAGLKLKG